MVDDVARKHFPPCMLNLYERLKRDHHLKHFGRLQLGLFLKVSWRLGGFPSHTPLPLFITNT
jgi:hypothetical protein